ncbi:protein tyrosine/serine phosphatase [Catenulispora acidiphila DSM 44928]|uniref:Protein tyrosine/serine phosphatase n=1 Tax=Catenulispora acidiphila (strain DSM 44928 / JCM 14897 / NBRC 102108 / NRRL B-24433 / ID139908) TaxID=479433 RepID=C7QBN1_CATAD|nr:tyrosine-protein phosphatase [Catenulispora acidiphila]ACU70608.1 protein tyrosine/serine phosphatase [Catenulispora acidiphila DSM 44928]
MIATRNLAWDGCVNVRDLGGLGRIKPGAVVRMEAPTSLTAAGWTAAWDHGVRTVLDLRAEDESEADQTPRPDGIAAVRVPLDPEPGTAFHDHWTPIDNMATPLYLPALLAEYPDRVVAAVRAIATAAPGCVVFHCSGGKDRSGLIALVLLAFAGAEPEEIVADYLLTFDRMKARYDALGIRDQRVAVGERLAQHGTTIEASLSTTIAGLTMPGYLLDNGLSAADLSALESRLSA